VPAYERVGNNADVGRGERLAYLDADALGIAAGDTLTVRAWRPGDRFRPLGLRLEKKLQDYFSDAKVPRELRARLPLIFGPRHLLWVAGQRIDDRGRISPHTRRYLVIELEPLAPSLLARE
jgi:tRNA(Ile)-lysidine synthase